MIGDEPGQATKPGTSIEIAADEKIKGKTFRKIACPRFNPVVVANELLRPSQSYRGRKEVLFAGFCVWVLVPESSDLRKDAMRLAARRVYDEACDELIKKNNETESPTPKKWKKKDIRIFRDRIYDVLGGHTAMYESISSLDLEDHIETHNRDRAFVLRLAEIWHYLIASGSVTGTRTLSISKGCDLAGTIGIASPNGSEPASGRHVERMLDDQKSSIAFLYAASNTLLPKVGTVLDQLREHDLTLEQAQPILQQWFARAKYFDTKVLSRLAKSNAKSKGWSLRGTRIVGRFADLATLEIEAEEIPEPHFQRNDLDCIEAEYVKPSTRRS